MTCTRVARAICTIAVLVSTLNMATAAVSLSELIDTNGSIVAGGATFDQFTFSSTGEMPSAGSVTVEVFTDANGNTGLRFSGGFVDGGGGGDPSTLSVTYRATSIGFTSAQLAGNPAAFPEDRTASIVIDQTFTGLPSTLMISDTVPGGPTSLLDSVAFDAPVAELNVAWSINADALDGGATASFVDQTYGVVPEPASVLIWVGSLAGFGLARFSYRRWWQKV